MYRVLLLFAACFLSLVSCCMLLTQNHIMLLFYPCLMIVVSKWMKEIKEQRQSVCSLCYLPSYHLLMKKRILLSNPTVHRNTSYNLHNEWPLLIHTLQQGNRQSEQEIGQIKERKGHEVRARFESPVPDVPLFPPAITSQSACCCFSSH